MFFKKLGRGKKISNNIWKKNQINHFWSMGPLFGPNSGGSPALENNNQNRHKRIIKQTNISIFNTQDHVRVFTYF